MRLITDKNGLERAARNIQTLFQNAPNSSRLGRRNLFRLPDHGIWMDYWRSGTDEKHWIEFGLLKGNQPTKRIVQINMAFSGVREGFTGQIAVDDNRRRWLFHRGHLKAKGSTITTRMFDEAFDLEKKREMLPLGGSKGRSYYRVACLDSETAIGDIAEFVKACARVRRYWMDKLKSKSVTPTDHELFERKLKRTYVVPPRDPMTVESKHDLVVNALAEELKKLKLIPSDERQMRRGPDLFYGSEGAAIGLFEVKTGSDPYSIYTAIGQLLFYSELLESPSIRVVVLPDTPQSVDLEVLERLGISLLRYSILKGDEVRFQDDIGALLGLTEVVA